MQTYIFQPDLNSTDFCMCRGKKINGGFPWGAKCKGIYTIFLLCFVFFKFLIINKHYFYNKNKNRTTSCPVLALQFTSLLELLGGRDHFSSPCLREIGRTTPLKSARGNATGTAIYAGDAAFEGSAMESSKMTRRLSKKEYVSLRFNNYHFLTQCCQNITLGALYTLMQS